MRSDLIYCGSRSLMKNLTTGRMPYGDGTTSMGATDKNFTMFFLAVALVGETIFLPISLILSLVLKSEEKSK